MRVEHSADIATSPLTTTVSFLAAAAAWAFGHQAEILFVLTVLVLISQLIAWGYKFYKWFKEE